MISDLDSDAGPAVASAIRLLLLYLGLQHSGGSRKDSDIKIDHAALNVYDLDVSEAFYREALGLSVGARVASSLLVCVDGTRRQSCAYALGAATRPVQNAPPWIASSGLWEARSVEEVNRTKGILNTLGAQWSERTQMYHEGPRQPEFTLAILTVRGSTVCSGEPTKILAKELDLRPSAPDLEEPGYRR